MIAIAEYRHLMVFDTVPEAPAHVETFAVTSSQIGVRFTPSPLLTGPITGYTIELSNGSFVIKQALPPHRTDPLQQVLAHLQGTPDGSYEFVVSTDILGSTKYVIVWQAFCLMAH